MTLTESLATPSQAATVKRWARLREDLRRCELRRGAWYPVVRLAPDEVVIQVRRTTAHPPERMRCGRCEGVFEVA